MRSITVGFVSEIANTRYVFSMFDSLKCGKLWQKRQWAYHFTRQDANKVIAVNKTLNHLTADELLHRIATRTKKCCNNWSRLWSLWPECLITTPQHFWLLFIQYIVIEHPIDFWHHIAIWQEMSFIWQDPKEEEKKEEKTLNPSIATPDNQDCKNVILEALLLFLKINSSKFANTPIWLYPKSARMKGSNAHKTLRNGQQG